MTYTVPSAALQAKYAQYATKMSKANKLFAERSLFSVSLSQQLQRHVNGSQKEPYRKMEMFVEHNSASELARVAELSQHAQYLKSITGRDYEMAHLWPQCRGSQHRAVNNVDNLIIVLRETNQMIGKRAIKRADAEMLDRMVFSGDYVNARKFAEARCY